MHRIFQSKRRAALLTFLSALILPLTSIAQTSPPQSTPKTIRIGYQKFNTLNILKGTGNLEKALKPLGVNVQWYEFLAGPQLLEALNTGNIDFGHAADAPSVTAQAAGVKLTYLAAEQPYPRGIGILAKQDSPLQSVKDLKDKKVAIGRG